VVRCAPIATSWKERHGSYTCTWVQEVRELFRKPEILAADQLDLQWKAPDTDGLVAFLVHDKQFSEERVRSAIDRMNAARSKSTQGRLETFFKVWTIVL
jgi:flap endonuclease-1